LLLSSFSFSSSSPISDSLGTFCSYGQTGSGKSFTMMGYGEEKGQSSIDVFVSPLERVSREWGRFAFVLTITAVLQV
jgi:hypothetical protein